MYNLGLIAGGGDLPRLIQQDCIEKNIPLFIAAIDGTDANEIPHHQLQVFSVSKAGAIIDFFKVNNVKKLIICGALKRPNFKNLLPDAKGLAFISKVILKSLGDDALLKTIRQELESEGFEIIAAQDLLPTLLAPHGSLAIQTPDEFQKKSIILGWRAAKHHGEKDLGQSVIVQNENIIGLENEKGTDALIKQAALISHAEGHKPILIKRAKPMQDMALDAPTIGLRTIQNLIEHNYAGLVIEAHKTLMLNQEQIIDLCNKNGLFLEVLTDEDICNSG